MARLLFLISICVAAASIGSMTSAAPTPSGVPRKGRRMATSAALPVDEVAEPDDDDEDAVDSAASSRYAGRQSASKSIKVAKGKGEVGIRGGEDLELNCPTISYKFPNPSTLRCESCKTLGRILHYSVVHYYRTAEDMLISGPSQKGPELCVIAPIVAELRQKTNGRRFWDLTRLMKGGDLIEHSPYVDHDYDPLPPADRKDTRKREIMKGRAGGFGEAAVEDTQSYPEVATNDRAISVNNRRITYHTKEERETLPCANYFLNRYCSSEYLGDDDTSDAVDGCINVYLSAKKAAEASIATAAKKEALRLQKEGETNIPTLDVLEDSVRRRQAAAADQRSTNLLNCLTGKLCGSLHRKECDTRALIEMQKGERDDFLRYEAKYGNKKNPFVGTSLDARKLERNPYATNNPSESRRLDL